MRTYVYGYSGARLARWEIEVRNQNVDPEFLRRLFLLCDWLMDRGVDYGFGGGWRSSEQQTTLFKSRHYQVPAGGCCSFEGKRWALRPGMAHAAPPYRSYHESTTPTGDALAYDMIGDHTKANEVAGLFGLRHFANINREPWHYQPVEVPNSRSQYSPSFHPLPVWSTSEVDMSKVIVHNPVRLVDTRVGKGGPRFAAGESRRVQAHGLTPDGAAVMCNITVINGDGAGFVTVYDGNGPLPEAAVVNWDNKDTDNGFFVVPTTGGAAFTVYASGRVDLIVDQVAVITG